jgi:hypothetical protein
MFPPNGRASEAVAAAVVLTVKALVPLPPEASVTLVGLKLHVGSFCAPDGELVKVQVRFIVPEYVLPAERATDVVNPAPG